MKQNLAWSHYGFVNYDEYDGGYKCDATASTKLAYNEPAVVITGSDAVGKQDRFCQSFVQIPITGLKARMAHLVKAELKFHCVPGLNAGSLSVALYEDGSWVSGGITTADFKSQATVAGMSAIATVILDSTYTHTASVATDALLKNVDQYVKGASDSANYNLFVCSTGFAACGGLEASYDNAWLELTFADPSMEIGNTF